jgi:chlorobactene glucosyltransferase
MTSAFNVHPLRTAIINAITAAVAAGLAANRRRHPPLAPTPWPDAAPAPYVEIIVPARNEERNICRVLDSLAAQRYPNGRWGITAVDDQSTDRTAELAGRYVAHVSNLRVVTARELPTGWTGKNNAMYSGYLAAQPAARYLLFVDADTRFSDLMLSTIVQAAEAHRAAVVSLVLDVELRTFWQRLLVPQTGELYALLVGTMDSANRPEGAVAANGQCMLVRRDAYARHGARPEVRGNVAEDRALAFAVKRDGGTVRLEHGERLGTVEPYSTLSDAWNGYSKTLYWAADRNTLRTFAAVLALEMYAHLPWWSFLRALFSERTTHRRAALAHAPLQLLPMLAVRLAVCRLMHVPGRYALAYPLGVLVGNAMLLHSWWRSRSRQGVSWKGRSYR